MKKNNLENKQIGFWKVGESFKKGNKIYYHCECICGQKKDIYSSCLNLGKSLSCGCRAKTGKVEDITGKDFGWLHVDEKIIINNRTFWKCHCKCGNHAIISQHKIHDCNLQSCGCRGDISDKIRDGLKPYCVDGTYLPGLNRSELNKNNTSGYRGVGYRKDRGKWRAYIKFQRKNIHLGNFDFIEDAIEVRKLAEKIYFGKYLDD